MSRAVWIRPTTAQMVRILLCKSAVPASLDPDRGVSAPPHARARAGGRGAQGCVLVPGKGKEGTLFLTSGWSLKRLSRKRPRLNSISRAEPLATVTRLRWFRVNMLVAPRLCLPSVLPALSRSRLLLSLDARAPVRPGISSCLVPKPRPGDDTWAGLGAAPYSPTPAKGLARRASTGARRAWPDSPTNKDTLHFTSTAWAHPPSGPGLRRLTWEWEDPKKPRPHPLPPVKPEPLSAENPVVTWFVLLNTPCVHCTLR